MSYYTRAFCTSDIVPPLDEVINYVKNQGIDLSIQGYSKDTELNSVNWKQRSLVYKKDKLPFLVEVNRKDNSSDRVYQEEINEFKEFLDEVNDSPEKKKVLDHLSSTKYIVVSKIPTSDFDNEGYKANSFFLDYFVKNYGGLIQADGEGFYGNGKLIVKLH